MKHSRRGFTWFDRTKGANGGSPPQWRGGRDEQGGNMDTLDASRHNQPPRVLRWMLGVLRAFAHSPIATLLGTALLAALLTTPAKADQVIEICGEPCFDPNAYNEFDDNEPTNCTPCHCGEGFIEEREQEGDMQVTCRLDLGEGSLVPDLCDSMPQLCDPQWFC